MGVGVWTATSLLSRAPLGVNPGRPGGACPYGRTREDDSHLRPHLPVSSDIKYEARAGRHLLVLTLGPSFAGMGRAVGTPRHYSWSRILPHGLSES